ncbi:MAG: hypothetical protein AAFQ53_05375 [Bacteroidota bacterium]
MTPLRRSALLRIVLLLVAMPLFLLGCDTAEDMMFQDDTVFVDAAIDDLIFAYDAADFDGNGTATVAGPSVFLDGGLLGNFTRDDVESISGLPDSGELLIDRPLNASIDEIASAELFFGDLLVGSAQVTMMDDDEVLRIATTDLTSLRNQSGFNTTLRITLADPSAAQDYELEARVTLRFEVQP